MKHPRELYDAGAVKRWHTMRTIQTQTVADHSWGVITILLQICTPSVQLLRVAAFHDLAEVSSGDVPAPVKWAYPKLDKALKAVEDDFNEEQGLSMELTESEAKLLKWADMLELVMFSSREILMGNRLFTPIRYRGLAYLGKMGFPTESARQLYQKVASHAALPSI